MPGLRAEPRFRAARDVVEDLATGLVWTRSATISGFPVTWKEALGLVEGLNAESFGGRRDWRLPDRREMRSLIDYSRRDPALPEGHPFTGVFPGWCWTSTPRAGNPDYVWYVHTEGGRMFFGRKDGYCLTWPVSGNSTALLEPMAGLGRGNVAWDADRFEVRFEDRAGEGEDWVLDRATGLIWAREAGYGPMTWAEALEAARNFDLPLPEGYAPWSLPTINELESLCDAGERNPALPAGHPFRNVAEVYHSSTTSGYEPDWAMALYMHKGAVGVGYKPDARFGVWFVARKERR